MRRSITLVVALAALAVPLAASAGNNYNPNPNASDCGQYHGAFGAFGQDNNFAGGADGQATGDANSAKGCQRNL
jgi:Spy/CpxP family protein refolding chaperone